MSEQTSKRNQQRRISKNHPHHDLGPFSLLPGVWANVCPETGSEFLPGRGWNSICLPFRVPSAAPYRLLVNQYNEVLRFSMVDGPVANRGLTFKPDVAQDDQFLFALNYEQTIHQIAAEDQPASDQAGLAGEAIHHEPGLFLNLLNHHDDEINIVRMASTPHGDAILAPGNSGKSEGTPIIPAVNGLPTGVPQDFADPYLAPYAYYHNKPYMGLVDDPAFPGFDPMAPQLLLDFANKNEPIKRSTLLDFDTTLSSGGIQNIPFIIKRANASSMRSTFWIQELERDGQRELRLQYLQVVMINFFRNVDGTPGTIAWPHVSINTMVKVSDDPDFAVHGSGARAHP